MDSYQYLNRMTRLMVQAWIKREPQHEIPWTPLRRPLAQATVALISSAAVSLQTDQPFDQEGERRDPWHGDESYRRIPRDATERDVDVYHLHINTSFAERDLNCALPLQRLIELEATGEIGHAAPTHYSFQGYILDPDELLEQSAPAMIQQMQAEQVDIALLVPV
jgi:D-proline reductase (dithiol) PrdB